MFKEHIALETINPMIFLPKQTRILVKGYLFPALPLEDEGFAPDHDTRGLPLAALAPLETFQGLVGVTKPVFGVLILNTIILEWVKVVKTIITIIMYESIKVVFNNNIIIL